MTDGEELPGPRSVIDVQVADRQDLLVAFVLDDQPADGALVVTVAQDRSGRRVRVPVGEEVGLVWSTRGGPRGRGARLLEVVLDGEPTWRLEPLGEVYSAQRRGAVRAAMGVPVVLSDGDRTATGSSLDLSETGVRGRWPVQAGWPAVLDRVTVTLELTDGSSLSGPAEVRRGFPVTDGRLEASLVFLDWPERAQDQVRGRVFERLRHLARRGDL